MPNSEAHQTHRTVCEYDFGPVKFGFPWATTNWRQVFDAGIYFEIPELGICVSSVNLYAARLSGSKIMRRIILAIVESGGSEKLFKKYFHVLGGTNTTKQPAFWMVQEGKVGLVVQRGSDEWWLYCVSSTEEEGFLLKVKCPAKATPEAMVLEVARELFLAVEFHSSIDALTPEQFRLRLH
jgi:hypothetical protein